FINATSCDATHWCAAMAMFSYDLNMNTNVANNPACLQQVGIEPFNFAFVTLDGTSQVPADPLFFSTDKYTFQPGRTLGISPGDNLTLSMFDPAAGLRVVIHDRTTGDTGSMTASKANGFRQVVYAPHAASCRTKPYAFHPMYASSSEHTRVPWGAH